MIYSGIPGNATLLFSNWEGIRRDNRVALKGTKCKAHLGSIGALKKIKVASKPPYEFYAAVNSTRQLVPSKRISGYIDRFLSQYIPEKKYIAVMLRTEKLFRNSKTVHIVSRPPDNNSCIQNILSDWKEIRERKNLSATLLFSDIGSYGSMRWNRPSALNFSQYIQNTLPLAWSPNDVNSAFVNMTSSKDAVQMAILEQQLVTHATCVVIVGGGSFHSQTFNLYAHNHIGRECYTFRGQSCSTFAHFIR